VGCTWSVKSSTCLCCSLIHPQLHSLGLEWDVEWGQVSCFWWLSPGSLSWPYCNQPSLWFYFCSSYPHHRHQNTSHYWPSGSSGSVLRLPFSRFHASQNKKHRAGYIFLQPLRGRENLGMPFSLRATQAWCTTFSPMVCNMNTVSF
jgi:hypothetical protein